MTCSEMLVSALTPVGLPIYPDVYTGDGLEYLVYNYNEYPDLFGDDTNEMTQNIVQLHYFLPLAQNPTATKRKIKKAIYSLGETAPTVINASDGVSQHFVFEFSIYTAEDANG